jgi:hypothetical protein
MKNKLFTVAAFSVVLLFKQPILAQQSVSQQCDDEVHAVGHEQNDEHEYD